MVKVPASAAWALFCFLFLAFPCTSARPSITMAEPKCENADNPLRFTINGRGMSSAERVFLTVEGRTTELEGVVVEKTPGLFVFLANAGQVPNGKSYAIRVGPKGGNRDTISFASPDLKIYLGNNTAPTALSVSPTSAKPGERITIVGDNFMVGATAFLGGRRCSATVFVNSTVVECVVPPDPGVGTDPLQVSVVSCEQDAPLWDDSAHFTYYSHTPHGLNDPDIAAYCPNQCHNHGVCNQTGQYCSCFPGYDGPACQELEQLCYQDCSGHGVCDNGKCICDPDYIGNDCSIFAALDISHPCIIYQNCTKGDMVRYVLNLFPGPEWTITAPNKNAYKPTVETSHGKEPYNGKPVPGQLPPGEDGAAAAPAMSGGSGKPNPA